MGRPLLFLSPTLLVALAVVILAGCGAEDAPRGPGDRATPTAAPAERGQSRGPARRARVEVLATGLVVPWDVAFLPDGRALVTERAGRIRVLSSDGRLRARPAARVATAASGEGGLLGVAVDPEFGRGADFVYVYVTRASGMQVRRLRWRAGGLADDGLVLGGIAAGSIHDSGRLRFGPDGMLYVATGDAGRRQLAQDRASRNGKVLRLTRRQYRARAQRPDVFSLGHRNPQGLAWQPRTDRLFATDHGPSGFDGASGDDEVNLVRRGSNHGWPRVRGRAHRGFAAPVQVYAETIAPSGVAFVTRPGSSWSGSLIVAALKGQTLRRLRIRGRRVVSDRPLLRNRFGRLRAVTEAPDGSLWVTTSNRDGRGAPRSGDDRVLRVVPPRR